MKRILFFLPALALACFVGCEMHPPSETVEGYAEKEAEKKAEASAHAANAEPLNPNPPSYFPKDK